MYREVVDCSTPSWRAPSLMIRVSPKQMLLHSRRTAIVLRIIHLDTVSMRWRAAGDGRWEPELPGIFKERPQISAVETVFFFRAVLGESMTTSSRHIFVGSVPKCDTFPNRAINRD